MNVIIRPPLIEDAYDIRRIQAEGWMDNNTSPTTGVTKAFLTQECGIQIPPLQDKIDKSVEAIKNYPERYFIAEYEGKVVGWIMGHSYEEGSDISSFGIYIDRTYRKKGIGTLLMKSFLDAYQDKKIKIEVAAHNANGIRFYTRFGFKVVREEKKHLTGDVRVYLPIVIMQNYE